MENRVSTEMDVEGDLLRITPLGAGQEVGRSCILVEFRGKNVMLDCGIHPGLSGLASLPYIDQIDPEDVDILFVTHFHLDHSGALPWFLNKTTFKGRVFMTHATKSIYKWLLFDYAKIMSSSTTDILFSEKELENSLDKIETVHFHREYEISNVSFTCYHAGHVLGAAMFYFNIAGVKILYTGDFSRCEDRHLISAEIPPVVPDILIMESTYGIHIHEDRLTREHRFTSFVHDTINKSGNCLIPVFSLGRAQELLLILEEYWRDHPELQRYPVYYASSLAKKCMNAYQTNINFMNENIRQRSTGDIDDSSPCVVLASPGMLQSGISRTLCEEWCSDSKNGIVLAGYAVDGTLAKDLASEPDQIISLSGKTLQRRCALCHVSFSAHADYAEIKDFVLNIKPKQLILVHGERHEMSRMKNGLIRDCENMITEQNTFTPSNCMTVELSFKGHRNAKVIGSLSQKLMKSKEIEGLLVRRGFSHRIMTTDDLQRFTENVTQNLIICRMAIPFESSMDLLFENLSTLLATQVDPILKKGDTVTLCNGRIVLSLQQNNTLILQWEADVISDVFAEAIAAVILETNNTLPVGNNVKEEDAARLPPPAVTTHNNEKRLIRLLRNVFGENSVKYDNSTFKIHIKSSSNDYEREEESTIDISDLVFELN